MVMLKVYGVSKIAISNLEEPGVEHQDIFIRLFHSAKGQFFATPTPPPKFQLHARCICLDERL